jgi:hypothetical protein
MLLVTTSARVPRRLTTRVPRRLTTGRLTELAAYLANAADAVPLILDLLIAHERFGSTSDPSIKGHLHYPNDIAGALYEAATDKIRQYHADYNNRPSNAVSFMSVSLVLA